MKRVDKETVGYLKSQQVIFPDWMEKACHGLADDAMIFVEGSIHHLVYTF